MTNETALKPCPFCGEAPRITKRMDEDLFTHNVVEWKGVRCINCDVQFDCPPDTEQSAAEQWNTRALPAQGEPVAWVCSDDRFPYLKGIVTDRKATVDAWREGCIKFDALVRAALPSSPAISPADLAEVLENVRKAIENLSDFRSVKNVPIELHKACHALTHIVALLKP